MMTVARWPLMKATRPTMTAIWRVQVHQHRNLTHPVLRPAEAEAAKKNDISGSTTFRPRDPKAKKSPLKRKSKIHMCSLTLLILYSVVKCSFRVLSTVGRPEEVTEMI